MPGRRRGPYGPLTDRPIRPAVPAVRIAWDSEGPTVAGGLLVTLIVVLWYSAALWYYAGFHLP